MEAATVEQAEQATEAQEPAATVPTRSLFRYSEFVHVGDGAAECPTAVWLSTPRDEREGDMPECTDDGHFHAWCRLPNPYQHEDIRKKGLAAKARKLRELRDPESDASVVLDEELAGATDPAFIEQLIDELLVHEWPQDYLEAKRAVDGREEYEHIDQDREELERLGQVEGELPEDERSDEYRQLVKHVGDYLNAVREELAAIQEPKKQSFRDRPTDEVVKLVRSKRVDDAADSAFMETYQVWMWFVGTFDTTPHPTLHRAYRPRWEHIGRRDIAETGTMLSEPTEVVEALKSTYNGLELAMQRGSSGN